MGTYVRYPCAHTTKKPLPTVGGFLERLVKRDANPACFTRKHCGHCARPQALCQNEHYLLDIGEEDDGIC